MSLRMTNSPPPALKERVASYALGTYKFFFIESVVIKHRRGVIGLIIRSSSALFKSQSDQRPATPPPPRTNKHIHTRHIV